MEIALDDGAIRVKVTGRDGTSREHEVDVVILQLACEEVESLHNLPRSNGQVHATAQFLYDLAKKLESLGIPGCTPSMALALWHGASQMVAQLKKNTGQMLNSLSGTASTPLEEPPLPFPQTEPLPPSPSPSPESKEQDCGCC